MVKLGHSSTLLFFALMAGVAFGQKIQWAHHVSSSMIDMAEDHALDADGNIFFTGSFEETISVDGLPLTSRASSDIFLYKLDKYGNALWGHVFGGPEYGGDVGVATDAEGNCYIAGGFIRELYFDNTKKLTGNNYWNSFVAKLSPSGNLLWVKGLLGASPLSEVRVMRCMDVGPDGAVVLAAVVDGDITLDGTPLANTVGNPSNSLVLAKFDATGNLLWTQNPPATANAIAWNAHIDQEGAIFFTGYFTGQIQFGGSTLTSTTTDHGDIFLVKYSSSGTVDWARGIVKSDPENLNNEGTAIDTDPNTGDVFLGGNFKGKIEVGGQSITGLNTSEDPAVADIFLARFSSNGALLWLKRRGTTFSDVIHGMALTDNNSFVITGGHGDGFTLFFEEFDLNGQFLRSKDFGGMGIGKTISLAGESIILSGILLSNFSEDGFNFTSSDWDGIILKYGLEENPEPGSGFIPNVITPNADGLNDAFRLPTRYIGSPIKIFNRWGQLVFSSSSYENNWRGVGNSDGIYYYQINSVCCGTIVGWLQVM